MPQQETWTFDDDAQEKWSFDDAPTQNEQWAFDDGEQEQFQPSLLEQFNQSWINKPLSHQITGGPAGKHVAELLDPSELDPTKQARIPDWIPFVGGGTYRSLIGGAAEGATNVAEGFTTPLNLATMGAFSGAGALSSAAPKAASALNTAGRVLSAPVALTGTQKVLNPELSAQERLFGLAEAAGGITGMAQKMPKIQPGAGRQPIPEAPINFDPNFNQGMGSPEMAGSTPYKAQPNAIPEFEPTVTLKSPTPAKVADLRNKGYVSAGVDKDGFPQMVHKEFLDKVEKSTQPSLFGPDEIVFDEEIKIKNPSASTIKRLKDEGYELVHVDEHGNEAIFKPIQEQEMRLPSGEEIPNEFLPDYPYQEDTNFERRQENRGPGQGLPERRAQDEQFLRPSDRTIPNKRQNELLDILGGKQKSGIQLDEDWMPQEMKVKGVREGEGGLENIAVGGADPRVLDVLGSSLYTKPRPVVTMKELLQNAIDEHRISGNKSPIRVLTRDRASIPNTGEEGNAITVRDRGRGLNPEEMYTVLTDVGKTGKAGIESASGGFGFAKAAPFLGGKYVEVSSVVLNEAGQKVKYSFQGDPAMLKNQARGVPLNREAVDPNTPTGLEVTTYFPKGMAGNYSAREIAKNMAQLAKKGGPELWLADATGGHLGPETSNRSFLDSPSDEPNYPANNVLYVDKLKGLGLPKIQGQVETPGAKVDIRYDTPRGGQEAAGYDIHYMNKGLYQQSDYGSYGNNPVPNVPRSIVADISALVEEGQEGYPFGANREQIDRSVNQAIESWIDENIKSGAQRSRVAKIQEQYDNIQAHPNGSIPFHDRDGKLLADEVELITTHPEFERAIGAIDEINGEILAVADTLNWSRTGTPEADWVPSQRLKKFGVLFQGPDSNGVTYGIHIPRPDDLNNSAILINVMEHLNHAITKNPGNPLDNLATGLYTTITHELAHIPGGGHDTSFAYRHAQLLQEMGKRNTVELLGKLKGAFDDGSGRISSDVYDLLSIYNDSRKRRATSKGDDVLSTGISSRGPAGVPIRERINAKGARTGENEPSPLTEAYNFSRGMLASWDLSAPLRQGLPLAFTKEWRNSIGPMLKALGPESAYKEVVRSIESKPLFQRRVNTSTGKILPSYAEHVGMKITDLRKSLSNREEATMSNWAEKYVPGVGRSNRAYNAFLNKLRADTFERLMNEARDIAGEEPGLNPYRNEKLARDIAEYVMTATGRGPLKIATPTLARDAQGNYRPAFKERSFEQAADILTHGFFSPKLITSRIRMLNPGTYVMASPFVRQQYLKSALTTLAAWGGVSGLAALAGADVSTDPNSADFGKIKIGDTRLDPGAGFQQYLVAFNRLLTGRTSSSATGEEHILGEGFQAETGKDVGERFIANKLHPVLKFAYDLWDASEYKPFNVGDRLMQMFVPLIVQDVYELATKNPELLPLIALIGLGMGAQTYEAGETEGKIIPPEYDYQVTSSPTKPVYDWFTGR